MGTIGIGHTRWATHGGVTEFNAHPHVGMNGRVAVVHNGIIENYAELRQEMTDEGDSLHLRDRYRGGGAPGGWRPGRRADLLTAVQRAMPSIQGASAFVFLSPQEPESLVIARLGNAGGIVSGTGDGEMFVASDIPAILEYTRDVIFLENRQMARVTRRGAEIFKLDGTPVKRSCMPSPGTRSARKAPIATSCRRRFRSSRAPSPTPSGAAWISTGAASC